MIELTDGETEERTPHTDTPFDFRPDLEALGIFEIERGTCDDTFENRQILRQAKLQWSHVYDSLGKPMDLLIARSPEAEAERRIISISQKKALLQDPTKNNSEYINGLDLLLDDEALKLCPPWVVGATAKWNKFQNGSGLTSPNQKAPPLPHRCVKMKTDGLRCMLWGTGRVDDAGFCKHHLRAGKLVDTDITLARKKIMQASPHAAEVLEDLMTTAQSEAIRMKSATEILDRAGVRGGTEIAVQIDPQGRSAAEIVSERLNRLASAANRVIESLPADIDMQDAEVVYEDTAAEERSSIE